MNRGDRREAIFRDDADRKRFMETLGEACVRSGWQVHAYCLMPNHFHLVVETSQPTLVAGMKWFLGTYRQRQLQFPIGDRSNSPGDLSYWIWCCGDFLALACSQEGVARLTERQQPGGEWVLKHVSSEMETNCLKTA